MRWLDRSFVCALVLCACGKAEPDAESGTGDATATADSSDTSTSSASASSTSSTSASSTTGATTTSPDSSGGADTGSTGSNTDNGLTEDSGGAGIVYGAIAVPGGLNRLRITKKNSDASLCTFITLVDPYGGGMFDAVDVTDPWGIEFANISDAAAACDSDNPGMFGGEAALEATGSIALTDAGAGGFPCTVDIEVTMTFQGVVQGIPMMDTMSAMGIPVEGC